MLNKMLKKFIFLFVLLLCLAGISEARTEPISSSITCPEDSTISFTYDNDGKVVSRTDSMGDTVNYAYAADGKITTITYPDNSTTTFNYDALDRITSMTDSLGGTTSYVYDDA